MPNIFDPNANNLQAPFTLPSLTATLPKPEKHLPGALPLAARIGTAAGNLASTKEEKKGYVARRQRGNSRAHAASGTAKAEKPAQPAVAVKSPVAKPAEASGLVKEIEDLVKGGKKIPEEAGLVAGNAPMAVNMEAAGKIYQETQDKVYKQTLVSLKKLGMPEWLSPNHLAALGFDKAVDVKRISPEEYAKARALYKAREAVEKYAAKQAPTEELAKTDRAPLIAKGKNGSEVELAVKAAGEGALQVNNGQVNYRIMPTFSSKRDSKTTLDVSYDTRVIPHLRGGPDWQESYLAKQRVEFNAEIMTPKSGVAADIAKRYGNFLNARMTPDAAVAAATPAPVAAAPQEMAIHLGSVMKQQQQTL